MGSVRSSLDEQGVLSGKIRSGETKKVGLARPTLPLDLLIVSGTNVTKAGHVMGGAAAIAADWDVTTYNAAVAV